jgi:hypothetical protein
MAGGGNPNNILTYLFVVFKNNTYLYLNKHTHND